MLWRTGLMFLAIILFYSSTGIAEATDSSSFGSGNISLQILDIKEETDNTIKIDYGNDLRIRVTYPVSSSGYIDIIDRDSDEILERYSLLENVGTQEITLSINTYRPVTNFSIKVALSSGETYTSTDKVILAEFVEPEILISMKNFASEIAKGDNLVITGTITASEYIWTVKGPYDMDNFYILASNVYVSGTMSPVNSGETEATVSVPDHSIQLRIPTHVIIESCGGTAGSYTLELWSSEHPDTVEEIDFSLADVSVDLVTARDEISAGEKLKLTGTTNVAKTGWDADNITLGLNKVNIYIYRGDTLLASYSANIKDNGTFEHEVEFSLSWDKNVEYRIIANVTTGRYSKEDIEFIMVKSPEVKIVMDDLTYTRGEEIRFRGTCSLAAGSSVYLEDDDLIFAEAHSTVSVGGKKYVEALVGADGSWQTDELRVKESASIGVYIVHAVIFSPGTTTKMDEDSVKINIVKDELDASVDKTIVVKGESITIKGTTTAEAVYVFSSDPSAFLDVRENPAETVYGISGSDMRIYSEDGKFTKTIKVSEEVEDGYYFLYLYAPPSAEHINTAEDPQKVFLISITSGAVNESEILEETPEPVVTEEETPEVNETAKETPVVTATQEEVTTTPTPVETVVEEKEPEQVVTESTGEEKIETLKPEDMTIPKLRRMLPGFEVILSIIAFLGAALVNRK
jgi:hypothetical protein